MDKNNDIKVNKVNKWDTAPVSIKNLRNYILESWKNYAAPPCCPPLDPSCQDSICESMMTLLESVLDDYNELEAKHQKDTGMISEYEEENEKLKSELDIKTDECDALISRVFKQDEEYTELKKENKELRETRELLNEVNSKQCAEVDDLEADIRDLEVQVRVNKGIASLYESEIKQVIDLAKSYGLIIYDDRKDAISDDVKNIGMCGHYYVLGGRAKEEKEDIQKLEKKWKKAEHTIKELMQVLNGKNELIDELKQHYEEELRIREKEKDEKDKLIDELNSKIMMLKLRTNAMYGCYGLNSKYGELLKKIETLEKENKELKDTIERNEDFGKYVGKCVAESIREGWEHNLYKLHPHTRIDIHVEQITDMPFAFNHCAIPYVAVMFNNTQTEMERDTAEHECEELNEKVDRLWRVNEELNRKIKRLEKETNKSCPVACECENFKPKVHHSYDPLDDLPDVEHS